MIGDMISRLARWARGAYPQWESPHGHVALVALCGQDASPIERQPRLAN